MWFGRTPEMVDPTDALPGRPDPLPVPDVHLALGTPLLPPWPDGARTLVVAMGCFWGAERVFWQLPGVHTTAVGYAGGYTPNPTYEEVCSGRTGHAEAVLVVFDPTVISDAQVISAFWESHDPTQGMRQGNDVGTQYRSTIYTTTPEQYDVAQASREAYADALGRAGLGPITTEIVDAPPFYWAEAYHQQYLSKNPGGYCGLAGTGVGCPVGAGVSAG